MKAIEIKHPLIEHKIGIMRNKKTGTKEFRELASEVAMFLCYEALRDAKTSDIQIETPLAKTTVKRVNEDDYAFVPILRAGMGMSDGITRIIPNAKIGVIGLYRNEETLEPVRYYYKVPKDIVNREVILLDPMLATGGSACDAIKMLKEGGVKKNQILMFNRCSRRYKKIRRNLSRCSNILCKN